MGSQTVFLKIEECDSKLLPLCRLFRPSYAIKHIVISCYRKIQIGIKNSVERLLPLIKLYRAFKG